MLKLEGLREKVARQFGWATARDMLPPQRLTQTLYKWRHNMAGRFRETPRLSKNEAGPA
jgi:hypothetical protein